MKHNSTYAALLVGLVSVSLATTACQKMAETPTEGDESTTTSLADATIQTTPGKVDLTANDAATVDKKTLISMGVVSSKTDFTIEKVVFEDSRHKAIDVSKVNVTLDNQDKVSQAKAFLGDIGIYYVQIWVKNIYGVQSQTYIKCYQNAKSTGASGAKAYAASSDGKSFTISLADLIAGGFAKKDIVSIGVSALTGAKSEKFDPEKTCSVSVMDKKTGNVTEIQCGSDGIVSGKISLSTGKTKSEISFTVTEAKMAEMKRMVDAGAGLGGVESKGDAGLGMAAGGDSKAMDVAVRK